jgi:hypothetical protein
MDNELLKSVPIGLFETSSDVLDDEELDKITLKESNLLSELLEDNSIRIFNITQKYTCRIQSCQHENNIPIHPIGFISKVSLSGIFTEIFNLAYYSNTTYSDIENLYPFERNIYLNMAKKEVEKQPIKSLL